ncbi:DNA recombination and repair protein Rad51 [Macrophomina phaseolina MS6]|uniref:DNA recombination and repair protein Rad51 n=1 Tax=Macrophomina phaseolina (strain MS6) TaxID=1126212 RepID=K2SSK6_MACPH|nr:DNA recombination and repair protein Rad51 [Macrophomina phaseolina MS6]
MSDLHHVLPEGFPAHHFAHLLPSLDRHRVTTTDILTLDAADLAKRAQVPVPELRRLQRALVTALHAQLGLAESLEPDRPTAGWRATEWRAVSTLDEHLDAELAGGLPAGYLTEITGESGAGKTQFLLTLLLAAQLPPPHGLSKSALYISTEAPLATTRLTQLLQQHPRLSSLPASTKPSLQRILSIQTPDLEYQDHVLRYQLPVAIARHDVGLVVLDSVAANYRAEFERPEHDRRAGVEAMARRSAMLVELGALLRSVARAHGVAVVVANQVSDRFAAPPPPPPPPSASATTSRTASHNSQSGGAGGGGPGPGGPRAPTPGPPSSQPAPPPPLALSPEPLSLDHQQRWFTGWGDARTTAAATALKTPALGLVWTNQLAARIALLKAPVYSAPNPWVGLAADGREDWRGDGVEIRRWRRWMKVVFAPWTAASEPGSKGVEFKILGRGLVGRGPADGAAEGKGGDGGDKAEGGENIASAMGDEGREEEGKGAGTGQQVFEAEGGKHSTPDEEPGDAPDSQTME